MSSPADTSSSQRGIKKEVSLGSARGPLFAWIALGIVLVAFLLHLVAFSTPGWFVSKRPYDVKTGLWKSCVTGRSITVCGSIVEAGNDHFKALEAFACLALIAFLSSVAVSLFHLCTSRGLAMTLILRGLTALLLLITVALAASYGPNNLGYSFALEVIALVLEVAGSILILVGMLG